MVIQLDHIINGKDYKVNDNITIHNPTMEEIAEFGEDNYTNLISLFVIRPIDMAVTLYDAGNDYRKIKEYDLFLALRKYFNNSDFLLNGLDISSMKEGILKNGDVFLYLKLDVDGDTKTYYIDKNIYEDMSTYFRAANYISSGKDVLGPGVIINENSNSAYEQFIHDYRMKILKQRRNPKQDVYGDIASFLINSSGFKYDYSTYKSLRITQFLNAFYRINKIQNAQQIMTGIYSGCIDSNKIDKEILNCFGAINVNYTPKLDESKAVTPTALSK